MSFLDLCRRRVSVRNYRPDPVPDELLGQVLEAGRMAPSAKNLQPWHFIVVRDPARRTALGRAYPAEWFARAPVLIAVCVEADRAWRRQADGRSYADVDGAIAMDHLTLCAADLGLGTCWIGAFQPDAVREALGLPDGVEPLAMTPLGYPADPGRPKQRKPLDEIRHDERW
jgi:nitroreductase